VSFQVTRPVGRALVVGTAACRAEPGRLLRQQGFECVEADDPYAAMIELSRHRLSYQTLILSLTSLHREELQLILTVRRRMPHVEIWLAQADGRMAALAEAMRLGADGLLAEDGTFHRVAATQPGADPLPVGPVQVVIPDERASEEIGGNSEAAISSDDALTTGEPVLTADELRALLQDQPAMPPTGASD
jgi:hypothetical protein